MVHGITQENIIRCISRPSKYEKNVGKKDSKETYSESKMKSWTGRNTFNWTNIVKHLPPFNRMKRVGKKLKDLKTLKDLFV